MEYNIRELQDYLANNLKEVDKVFAKYRLRYFLVSGTMLGAVRHKGFIPWDDDIDIGMPRKDYELLIKHSNEWLPEYLEFVCPEYDSDYPLPYGKIQDKRTTCVEKLYRKLDGGVFIDVFPLDGVPEGKIARWWHFRKFLFWRKAIYFMYRDPYKHGKGPSSWIPLMWQKLFKRKYVQKKLKRVMTECEYDGSHFMSEHYNAQTRFMPRSVFGNPTDIEFEGMMLKGVEQPDEYLTIEYGDYMTLPPENKRHQHNFHYLNLSMPYAEFYASDKV